MTRRNPFEELEQLFERMSQQVDTGDWRTIGESVSVDLADTGEALEIAADLPGYDREDIDITLSDGTLRIEAERETEATEEGEDEGVRYLRRERSQKSVRRSIRLPDAVEESDATATYRDGVLRVTLPKSEPGSEGKQIQID